MKTKLVRSLLILAVGGLIASQFTGCATDPTTGKPTGGLTPQATSAISTTATLLVDAAKDYQAIGSPGLPPKYAPLFAGLSSGAAQLQAQVGQTVNTSVINTGVPAVDSAIAQNITPGATVTQADVNTVSAAASLAAKPLGAILPTPTTSMEREGDPHRTVTVYSMLQRLGDKPWSISEPVSPNARG